MKKFLLFSLLISHFSFAQKLAVPLYSAGQIKFYDVVSAPATLLGTFNVVVAGTTYSPNGICFYGNEMFVTYDSPSSDGFLHFKGVSISGGVVSVVSGTKITTNTVTTEVVLDASGNLFVGCGFGLNRGVKKYTRDGSGNYSFSSNLAIPAVINDQWYNGIGGLAMDASGNLWASDLGDNRILKWTNATGSPTQFSCSSSPSFCQTQFQNTASQNVYPFSLPEGLVFDASGNLWIGNNNDGWGPNTNSTGGSLLKLNAAYLASGGNFLQSNITIYSTAAAKFGGLAKSGNEYYVNDQGNFKIWRINTATGALSDMSIAVTYPGNGQVADVPCSVFAAPTNPTANGTSINSGQTATLAASGCAAGTTYIWKNGSSTVAITASFTTPVLTVNTTYTAFCANNTCLSSGTNIVVTINAGGGSPTIDNHLKIDQFGYRTNDKKVAIISKASVGFNAPDAFMPSTAANQYQIKRVSDDVAVFTGTLSTWNSGNVDASGQTGDYTWRFDFSSLLTDGNYYVYDVGLNKKSYNFTIGNAVYSDVAKQAVKTFYYQRCGVAKLATHGGAWNDAVCHTHTEQDTDCRLASNPIAATSKDLSGGWHDAGDYNKYVNFALPSVDGLLFAYEEKPLFWGDNSNIPESGNGIPDILDELKIELDWLLKMQQPDGSVLSKVSVMSYSEGSPASSSNVARRYAPANTTSAFSFAAMLAHASLVYRAFPNMQTYANSLKTAAIAAYNWGVANPNVTYSNTGYASADVDGLLATYDRVTALRLSAAVYLFNLTGTATYKTFVETNYTNMHLLQWGFAYEYESAYQDALLYYAQLPTATSAVATAIKNAYQDSMDNDTDNLTKYTSDADAYRAYIPYHTFNSNHFKAFKGLLYQNMLKYRLNIVNNSTYTDASLAYINYLHGVNPLAKNYLSNMSSFGAENSVNEIYHVWFGNGTIYDGFTGLNIGPPPGFLVCGPDASYVADGGNAALIPPASQPAQKSYLDFNTSADAAWTVSEIAIYNQATYTRLLEKFITHNTAATSVTYCLPISNSGGNYLTAFTVNSIGLSQNNGFQENGYGFFAGNAVQLTKGSNYNFITNKNAATSHLERIWIDNNRDGDFDDADEQVASGTFSTTSNNGSFTVPTGASTGYTRLRIRISTTSETPCATNITGEVEDYVIEILPAACSAPANPTATANPATINSGQSSILIASGCASGNTYRWKQAGTVLVNTLDYTTPNLTTTTTYTAHCVNGTCESSGIPVVVSVNAPAGGVTQTGSISVTSALQTNNPRSRTFTFRLPNATPDCNRPLLIALHGDGGNGAGMMSSTGFNAIADAENFIAVYPNSLTVAGGVQWNKFADGVAGSGDNGNDANAADDEKFIADLIDYFYTTYGIDRSKVYVTGHSGGGFMTYALAISNQTKNKIAAIAPVAASLWGASSYINTQFGSGVFVPTPLLHLHSPTDGVVPFPTLNSWTWPLASFSYATCTNAAYTTSVISGVIDKHTFCGTGNKVILMALKQAGLGHGWPSTANSTYNGSQEIWNFMKDYTKGTYTVPNPTVSPMSVSVNSGQSTTLTASSCPAGYAYKWNTGATTVAISVSPNATTTYTAFCTYGNTCQSSGTSATVTVNAAGNTHSIVNCGQLTPSPATFRVGTTGTNSIKVFLNVTTATTLTLTATGPNFTGSVTQTFNAPDANAFVWVPINYDGGGLAGNRSIVISSSEAGVATCARVVEVLNPPIFTLSDCFNGTLSGTFVAGTPSTGSLVVNITVSVAGPAIIQVTGFSSTKIMGSLTTNLTMGQTSITIPVNYDGTGVVGDGDQTYLYSAEAQGLGTIPGSCYGPFYTLVASGNPCVSNVNVNGLVNPPPYTANQIIQASQHVIAGNVANPVTVSSANSNKLTLQAGKSVTLNPGFSINNGAVFTAKIEDCVATPTHQTFYTQGKDVYASNGQKIVIRGVNYPVMDDWDFPASDKITEIEKSGANAVRLQWYINQNTRPTYTLTDLDNLLTKCKNNRMVPILELHDVTCAEDMSVLNSTLVPWWTSPGVVSVLNNHKKYVIINLANELGKYRWANIYSGNSYDIAALNAWKNAYKTAITAIRAANLKMPIMIDGTDCGSDLKAFHQVGQEIIDHDPEHNIIFSAHAYWQYYPDQVADLNSVVAANVPLVFGEIANYQSADGANNCDYDLSDNVGFKYQDFLTYLQTNQMGWLAWTWVRDNCSSRNMTNNNHLDPAVFGKYNTLTTFGNDIVNNPTYGIKNTAVKAAAGAF